MDSSSSSAVERLRGRPRTWLELGRPDRPLPYLPGQAVSLESELRPRLWRWYSPANAPRPDAPAA